MTFSAFQTYATCRHLSMFIECDGIQIIHFAIEWFNVQWSWGESQHHKVVSGDPFDCVSEDLSGAIDVPNHRTGTQLGTPH